jgi:phospholipid/cholesterol/gamma-HCH transport system substrate-binding protein
LTEVKSALADFRKGQLVPELARAANRLNSVLVRADDTLEAIQKGEGSIGKVLKNKEAYDEAMQSLQDLRRMVASVKQNADAFKAMPLVRNYVIDPNKELIRPNCKRFRKWLPESDLFEPGRAVLTSYGKERLQSIAPWLNEHKEDGSEVVVAAFAAPGQDNDFAQALTQQQSEAVVQYLRSEHKVQRTGFWWWSNRKVQAIGCGIHPPPVPETEQLPPARVEFIVFVPEQ